MDFNEYQTLAIRTANNNEHNLPVTALGVAGEAGEVAELIKKHLGHNDDGAPLDLTKLSKELGDVLWYLARMCSLFNIPFDEVAVGNIAKLKLRFPDKFTGDLSRAKLDEAERDEGAVDEENRAYFRAVARKCAAEYAETPEGAGYAYLDDAGDINAPWHPHKWVVDAMLKAYEAGQRNTLRMSEPKREIVEPHLAGFKLRQTPRFVEKEDGVWIILDSGEYKGTIRLSGKNGTIVDKLVEGYVEETKAHDEAVAKYLTERKSNTEAVHTCSACGSSMPESKVEPIVGPNDSTVYRCRDTKACALSSIGF